MADDDLAHYSSAAAAAAAVSSSSSSSSSAKQSSWGWGKWGSAKFSVFSDLQMAASQAAGEITRNAVEAAKGAAKGVTELQTSVLESLGSEEKSKSEGHAQEVSDAPSMSEMADSVEAENEPTSLDEKMRTATLKNLEEASRDSVLGHGLKILDNSMESFASGAWQALGSAWKGGIGFVHKLESSAENLAGNIQTGDLTAKATALAPNIIQGSKVLTARGIQMLEYVGRETMDILVSETGIQLEDDLKQSDLLPTGDDHKYNEEITFDRCFYIYGGPEHLEELEALSSHHALLCNRARTKFSSDQRLAFDGLVKQIREILTLSNEDTVGYPTAKGKQLEKESTSEANEIKALYDSSLSKAAELATGFTATIGGLAMTEVVQKTADRLEAIKAEGVHRLSELCALCISHYVTLGNSLLATESSEDSNTRKISYEFEWPKDCVEKAMHIRAKASAMANDIEAVLNSFLTGIGDVQATFQAAIANEAVVAQDSEEENIRHGLLGDASMEERASAVSSSLESDGSTAIEKMQDGLHYLLYVVTYTSL